jgi:hypothetical protein
MKGYYTVYEWGRIYGLFEGDYTCIRLEGLMKTMKDAVRIIGVEPRLNFSTS